MRPPTIDPLDPKRYGTLRRLVDDDDNRLVVGFGGGSIPGLAGNLALAAVLEELGLRPRVSEIWGTSAGAVAGAGWATGTDATAILDLLRSLDRPDSLEFSAFRFGCSILASLWPLRRPLPEGLLRGEQFRATIDRGLRVKTFEECAVPFRCIACSGDGRARRKIFRRGPLLPAIFASMTIPGIVVPLPVGDDGEVFYDGGLVEKSPLLSPIAEHLNSGDPRKLLLLCTHFDSTDSKTPPRGFHQRFLQTISCLEDLAWGYQLAEARARKNVTLLLLNPRLQDPSLFDFKKVDANFAAARERFADLLQDAKIAHTFGSI